MHDLPGKTLKPQETAQIKVWDMRQVTKGEKRLPDGAVMIYALFEPGSDVVRYIGQTRTPGRRLWVHSSASNNKGSRLVQNWIRGLLARGLAPVMREVEVSSDGNAAEQRWIRIAFECGCPLLNMSEGGNHLPPTATRKGFNWTPMQAYRQQVSFARRMFAGNPEILGRLNERFAAVEAAIDRKAKRYGRRLTIERINRELALRNPPWMGA